MRFHKTFKQDRSTYTYEFATDEGPQSSCTIRPGERGVTEVDIKILHYMDDYEVERNIANHKLPWTPCEKREIMKWKRDYISRFEAKYGYKPLKVDVEYMASLNLPKGWWISADRVHDTRKDKTEVLSDQFQSNSEQNQALRDCIDSVLSDLSSRDHEIYERVLLYGESDSRVARDLGLSDVRVCQIAKEISEKLASSKNLKKFFIWTSDFDKNDRLDTQEARR